MGWNEGVQLIHLPDGAVRLEFDDGVDDAIVLNQLKYIEEEYGYICTISIGKGQYIVFDEDRIKRL